MGTTAQNSDRSSKTITLLVPTADHPIVQTTSVEPGSDYFEHREEPAEMSEKDFISGIDSHLDTVCGCCLEASFFLFLFLFFM